MELKCPVIAQGAMHNSHQLTGALTMRLRHVCAHGVLGAGRSFRSTAELLGLGMHEPQKSYRLSKCSLTSTSCQSAWQVHLMLNVLLEATTRDT